MQDREHPDSELAEEIKRVVQYLNDLLAQAGSRGTLVHLRLTHDRAHGQVAQIPQLSVEVKRRMEP